MNTLFSMGEMLIDFTQTVSESGVPAFERNAGGAPANVAVCAAKLGGKASMIAKLSKDAFGTFLRQTLVDARVDVSEVSLTDRAKTALAFVFLDERGERSFLFYRDLSADMLLSCADVEKIPFVHGDVLHFGSVALSGEESRAAHELAIDRARRCGVTVSFDPNLRYSLWNNREDLLNTVREFLPKADIVKVNAEELRDITGETEEIAAVHQILRGNTKIVLVTKGEQGSCAYTKQGRVSVAAVPVKCVDTTGAGDCFIGTFLYQMLRDGIVREQLDVLFGRLEEYLSIANRASSIVVSGKGAIPSMPDHSRLF